MENNSSLDPLGPEFGKVNAPAINTQSMSPFEGDTLKDNKIDYFPVVPKLSSTNPNYIIQDGITGHAPGKPSSQNPRKNLSPDELKNAINQSIQMNVATHRDKNEYARVNAYNAGPSGNSFYKRYAAYGQKKFDEVGFSPLRDNEAMYNAHTTMGDDFSRMMKNSFMPLLGRGFVSGPKSLVKMMQGDFSADLEDARAYENAAAIGQSSKKGMGAFFNNTAMSFAYTAGIISEAIVEEVAGALLAPVTGGGSFFAATANNARKIGKIGDAFDMAAKGYKAVNTTLKEANNINGARKMWKAAENIGASKIGKFLNPVENTFDAIMGIGKNADNLTGLARLAQGTNKTAGGLFRDIRNINMALSEARLEGGMTDNAVYDKAYDEFYKKNNRAPNNDEQYQLTKTAKEAGMNTIKWNTALIFATNKIVIPNLLKSGVSKRALQSKVDDVLNLKGGKVTFEKTLAEGKKIATGKFDYIEDSFKNSLKGFKKAPVMTTAKVAGRYLKANLMEGVQENLQDVISVANEKYYLDAYKNKELGAHLYNRAKSSLMYEGLKGQFSAQGFETFASGALMGLFSGGLNAVKGGLDYGYNNIFNKAKYQEYKALRKSHGEAVANRLTTLYSDPKEFFNAKVFNYGVQNNTVSAVEDANTKEGKDELSDAFVSQVHTALDTNTLNYFKDHIASFKEASPEEFEEAFGFEKGTGAKEQQKIDKILTNIDTIDKSYKYAEDRFPNPVTLSDFDKASPDYTKAAIFHSAWDNAKKSYVFSNYAFKDTIERMTKISGSILNNPSMEKMSQLDMDLIFQPSRIYNETVMLKNEIAGLKDVKDPSNKQQIQEKEDKLSALQNFLEAHSKYDVYHNRSTSEALLEAYKKEVNVEELSDEEKELILNKAYGEKNAENEYKVTAELEDAYKNYIKTVNGVDKNYIFNNDVDESFEKLLDHYKLGDESKKLVTYINLLHNPEGFVNQVEKAQTWMTDMYNNRKAYYTDMVNKQISGIENNEALNALADRNIFMDLDAFHAYMIDDVLPEEFFDETNKQVIPKGSEKYNEALEILALNKSIKSEDVDKPSLDETLQSEVDRLDEQEKQAIDNLEKVETIKKIKHEVAGKDKFTIDDVLKDLQENQYVDAKYDGNDQIVTMYSSFAGIKLDNSEGKTINTEDIKDKFSEYTIYTKKLEPKPEQVAIVKEKYDALRDEAAEKHANKKAKTKADIYSNYTPVEQLPKDLYKELQEVFQQTETAIKADEDDVSGEELMDLFKVFVKNNSLAEDVINEYNNKSKEAVEKEKLGEIDDFDFILNNKKLNTAKYSTEDIKLLRKQFEKLRDEAETTLKKTAYQDVINKFNKLISTRDVQKFSPEIQEIIKKLKEGLIAQQSKISKVLDVGYSVDGEMLERVTNFIQEFKSDKYNYSGAKEIKKAFESTIGAAGLSKTTIPSFINRLNEKLHVDSKTGNFGYTDETESILKKHLANVLKQHADKTLFKSKDELLADIQAVVGENAYEASRVGGTYIDDQLRSYFTKGEAPTFDEKRITREAYDNLFGPTSFLKPIKQKIDSGELFVIAKNLKVFDVESKVAGEMDLLLIDKEGKLQIIDFKTGTESKWNGFIDKTDSGLNKTEDYTLQQYTYARLLKKMTGLDADINIFPIETILDQNNKIVTSAKTPTDKKLTGPGNWYFPLDPNFSDAKAKIDKAIPIEAPDIKVATSINPVYKKQLKNMLYPDSIINGLSKEEAFEITTNNIPYTEYVNKVSTASITFGEQVDTATQEADIEKRKQEELDITPTASHGVIAADYLFTGGKGVILSTDYLLQAMTSIFPYAGKRINDIRNNYLAKLGDIKDDIGTDNYNSAIQEIRDEINNTYQSEKAIEIFEKILKNSTGFISREGNEVSSQVDKLNDEHEKKIIAKYNTELAELKEKPVKNKSVVEPVSGEQIVPVQFTKLTDQIKATTEKITIGGEEVYINPEPLKDIIVIPNNTMKVKDDTGKMVYNKELNEEGSAFFDAMDGRIFVVTNINGQLVPFYKSSAGTSGKIQGEWYPFFGYTGAWLVKGGVDKENGDMSYSPEIDDVRKVLNANLKFPDKWLGRDTYTFKDKQGNVSYDIKQNFKVNKLWQKGFGTATGDKYKIEGLKDNTRGEAGLVALITGLNPTTLDSKSDKTWNWIDFVVNKTALKQSTEVVTPVTKASELNLKEGDTVNVKEPIMEKDKVYADTGTTLTVLKSDEKSVSFTYNNTEKTLTLPELDKHVTTMDIEEVKQAEKTQEVLDAIDKQTITETVSTFDNFMNDQDAIKNAIEEADKVELTDLEDDLLNNLKCK